MIGFKLGNYIQVTNTTFVMNLSSIKLNMQNSWNVYSDIQILMNYDHDELSSHSQKQYVFVIHKN